MAMRPVDRILVLQTAFLGDVILTLPLVQVLKEFFAFSSVDVVVIPRAANILSGHPDIRRIIEFDKRGRDAGIGGLWRLAMKLRRERYSLALVPHRSLRSALLVLMAGIPIRVGFTKSAGRFLFTKGVAYQNGVHEIDRNLSLLKGIGIGTYPFRRPALYPSAEDSAAVSSFLAQSFSGRLPPLVAIAPGTVWNTKRWFKERFAELAASFVADGFGVVVIGGKDDRALSEEIADPERSIVSSAGKLTLLQSAELIRRCRLLVCNDSAPLHLATSVGTPIAAIFGATVPEFGFGPVGERDVTIETRGLSCRPCSIHGGDECPIETFECMDRITTDRVYQKAQALLAEGPGRA
jgi:heptosyltransferase-2